MSAPRIFKTKRSLAALALTLIAVALVAAGAAAKGRQTSSERRLALNAPLPSMNVADLDGKTVDLSTFAAGKRKVIVFYSPSCDACKQELPHLYPLPEALSLVMVRVPGGSDEVDVYRSTWTAAGWFVDRYGVLRSNFPFAGTPTVVFVDENGILRGGLNGPRGAAVTRQKLAEFAALETSR